MQMMNNSSPAVDVTVSAQLANNEGLGYFPRVVLGLGTSAASVQIARQRANIPLNVLMVDIDGTLSDPTHRRHLLDGPTPAWNAFHRLGMADPIREAAVAQLRLLFPDHMVLICSGRPAYVLSETFAWLENNDVPFDFLLLRPPLDQVTGLLHKLRVAEALEARGAQVAAILDDDPRVRSEFDRRGIRGIAPQ